MKHVLTRRLLVGIVSGLAIVSGCRSPAPAIRFAPAGTDSARLRSEYALTAAERQSLTPDTLRRLTQEQIDQIYMRLGTGPLPDGPFRGDLFFPRDRDRRILVHDLPGPLPGPLADIATVPVEALGRALWRGKVFFRAQGVLRNRIEDLAILKPIIPNSNTIPKLTFDGQTTWLLFPARVSCGESLFDPARRSIVIDYSKGPEIEGYRKIPDELAGPDGLAIRDEVRMVRPGLYLGRAYFRTQFGLNFTLVDPAKASAGSATDDTQGDCGAASQ
jgi:hypothetical protein